MKIVKARGKNRIVNNLMMVNGTEVMATAENFS